MQKMLREVDKLVDIVKSKKFN